jgi:LacI family transcriptional regulator
VSERLNLEEIGRLAGVSRSTVSRVVNGAPNVSDDAKARVEAVVEQTGFRPHAAARSLASNHTGVVGLVIPSAVETLFDDPYFGRLILGISRATNLAGTTLSLFLFFDEEEETAIARRVVSPGLVDGVIVTATRMGDPLINELAETGTPFVVVGRPDAGGPVLSVDVDNRGGAKSAVAHLVELGRKRIGTIAPPSSTAAGLDRRAGYLHGIADAGLSAEGLLVEGDWSEQSGFDGMNELLRRSDPDAVFAGSDRMAVGALRAIRAAGLACPGDVAVVSFDGLIPPSQTLPQLTSVTQPVVEVGERAAELLDSAIRGEVHRPQQIVFPTELVVRESCGAERGARA